MTDKGNTIEFEIVVDDSMLRRSIDEIRRDVSTAPPGVVRLDFPLETRAVDPEKRSVDVICSTTAIDAYGEIVVQDFDLRRALPSISVLWNHSAWELPIGKGTNVRVEDGKLQAKITFATEKANPRAEQIYNLWQEGCIRSISIGFRPTKRLIQTVNGKDVVHLVGNELLEISVVAIPANHEAVALSLKALETLLPAERSAPTNEDQPVQTAEETSMKNVAKALGLHETASEADVLEAMKSLESDARAYATVRAKLKELTGHERTDDAVAACLGWKSASAQLDIERKAAEVKERVAILKGLEDEKKLSPAMKTLFENTDPAKGEVYTLGQIKAWGATAPVIPAFADAASPPAQGSGGALTHNGKTWAQMDPMEKHALFFSNKSLFDAMKADAAA